MMSESIKLKSTERAERNLLQLGAGFNDLGIFALHKNGGGLSFHK